MILLGVETAATVRPDCLNAFRNIVNEGQVQKKAQDAITIEYRDGGGGIEINKDLQESSVLEPGETQIGERS